MLIRWFDGAPGIGRLVDPLDMAMQHSSMLFVIQYLLTASSHLCLTTPSFSLIPAADSNLEERESRRVKVSDARRSRAASKELSVTGGPVEGNRYEFDLRLTIFRFVAARVSALQ